MSDRQTDRDREKQRERGGNRQTDRQTDKDTDRQTETERELRAARTMKEVCLKDRAERRKRICVPDAPGQGIIIPLGSGDMSDVRWSSRFVLLSLAQEHREIDCFALTVWSLLPFLSDWNVLTGYVVISLQLSWLRSRR